MARVSLLTGIATLALTLGSEQALGLAMAEEEFAASRQLTCVLAQESLGYLSEEEFGALTTRVLDGFDDSERDAITAKSLGYVDGLMFGVDHGDQRAINGRFQSFLESRACTRSVGVHYSL